LGSSASQVLGMGIPAKQNKFIPQEGHTPERRRNPAIRAEVLIPANLPVTQIEIEIMAALLDDWEDIEFDLPKGR
jgi:hypothetical protein